MVRQHTVDLEWRICGISFPIYSSIKEHSSSKSWNEVWEEQNIDLLDELLEEYRKLVIPFSVIYLKKVSLAPP